MNDVEYDILDELYFLNDFEGLLEELDFEEELIKNELWNLLRKGWAKMVEKESEADVENLDFFHKNYKKYNYLATKAGLLAHNSR